MTQRVTAQRIAAEQDYVDQQHQCSSADSETIRELRGLVDVVAEQDEKDQRQVQEVAVNVLDDEWKVPLAEIGFARFADRAVGRIRPKRFVVCAAIIVASDAE